GQATPQPLPLGHIGYQLEEEDPAVGLAQRRARQLKAALGRSRDPQSYRHGHRGASGHGTARARATVGGQRLVAAADGGVRGSLNETTDGMAEAEGVLDQLEALADPVDET